MKVRLTGVLVASIFLSYSFNLPKYSIDNHKDAVINCDSTPALNQDIIAYVNKHIKRTVGRGECWDLAAEPLNELGATWDKNYDYGMKVNYKTDCIYPGDIIQFEGVLIKTKKGNMTITSVMDHHTAIVYEVKDVGKYIIAHQNTNDFGRKVGLSELDLANIQKGRFTIYRPYK